MILDIDLKNLVNAVIKAINDKDTEIFIGFDCINLAINNVGDAMEVRGKMKGVEFILKPCQEK